MKTKFILVLVLIVFTVCNILRSQDFLFGTGITFSTGYHDALEEAYKPDYELSGGFGWIDLNAGLRFELVSDLMLTPGISLLFNIAEGDATFINTITMPALSLQYFIGGSDVYISGELNKGFIHIDSDRFNAESNGIGYGLGIGYEFYDGDFEIGYSKIPAIVDNRNTVNFGGLVLKFKYII